MDKEPLQSGLDKFDNVYLLGPKTIERLPSYLRFFGCAIIPFKCNVLTSSIYPLKVNEYLAAGCPTISTNFSEDIESFKDVVYVADSHDEFLSYHNVASDENSPELQKKRIEISQGNTWENRVNQFWSMISE
jgi:hypothetical protein